MRVRVFLHVFLGCPKSADTSAGSGDQDGADEHRGKLDDPEAPARFLAFVQKMNACVNHLEQFPIRMHDAGAGGPGGGGGVRSASSTLRFFKTHHLKCSLQRHPDCASLKSWKGGLVKIDPLALVQAIERYLISRGYGHPQQDRDSGSDDDMSDDGADDMLPSTSAGAGGSSSGGASGGTGGGGGSGGAGSRGASSTSSSDPAGHRLEFYIGDNILPYDMTVYQVS